MTAFADTSAVVKLYADEPDSELMRRDSLLVVSTLTRVEVISAIWRKHRVGDLSAYEARLLVDTFLIDWGAVDATGPTFLPVPPATSVLDLAVSLCGLHGLRAYDAVQLASALQARTADSGVSDFVTYDVALHRAAAAEGFRVNPLT